MKFLEASRIVRSFEGGDELRFLLATSGEAHPLGVFLKAAAAERGFDARIRTLPFNTLAQAIRGEPDAKEREVFLLFPWDLLPAADWRSGIPSEGTSYEDLVSSATQTATHLRRRPSAGIVYVDAPIPALLPDYRLAVAVRAQLRALATELGADLLGEDVVSLSAHFEHGLALAPAALGQVARRVVRLAVDRRPEPAKVLVTDFDNTLWNGVVGEVGVEGLAFSPMGVGYPHFVYQTFLRMLRSSGVLLAGVTKNDPDLAVAPLQQPESVLRPDDFVSIAASYNPKSVQISELAQHLNLGLDSFVFVDDNPVEIAEVGAALPGVRLVPFPSDVEQIADLVSRLAELFHRDTVTAEDRDRTDLYRRRLAGMVPKDAEGSDLTEFLRDLGMVLTVRDRSRGDRERAVQLINKTNQFNLNGIRRAPDEVAATLSAGGRLYTAGLGDRHGDHGEILACLIDEQGVMRSFVMSCRVFERRVEHAFLSWLATRHEGRMPLQFVETDRNEPMRRLLRDPSFSVEGEAWVCDLVAFAVNAEGAMDLFEVRDLIHAS